jgi:hypothetical protein
LRRYGGDIKVTSEPGRGTTFEVLLPERPVFLGTTTRPRAGMPAGDVA